MEQLTVRGVCKRFEIDGRSVEVLSPTDLTLKAGEFGALIGPSGCGKSTLLRMIADILPPSDGTILIGGHEPARARREHEIGFVFQDPTLLPWRSVLDNVRLPLELVGNSARLSGSTPQELIDLVGLSGFEHARPGQLSGGMQQRAAIARALILSPQLLLLDEPFGALDEITRYRMNMELLRIRAETRTTSLMVTHSIQEAVFMADRIFVLAARPGRIVDVVEVEVERPRKLSVMNSPEFAAAVDRVRTSLFGDALGMLDDA
ncbi:ABC transporter ATP-binding protein [Flavisphingomonas formosensis]|uniref:ABC transporter ATP-binding protein n=1 Tax=Flavisphingomonas formosensis TaxID=861534 RepID=UPI0012F7A77A|nr:ABC transporter ATP-binding protein [Sphingomonas formosensis]